MKTGIFLTVAVAVILGACAKNEPEMQSAANGSRRPVVFLPEVCSRAAMENGFRQNDVIGIFMSKDGAEEGYFMWNIPYWYESEQEVWESPYEFYWEDNTAPMDVVAYYPYFSLPESQDLTRLAVDLPSDQSSLDSLRKSDFLWGKVDDVTADSYPEGVPLPMKHRFSKVKINMDVTVEGAPMTSEPMVFLRQVKNHGTVNLNTGEVALSTDNRMEVKMYYDAQARTAEAIVYPQTLEAGTLMRYLVFGENGYEAYGYKLNAPLTLEEGKEYVLDYQKDFPAFLTLPYDSVYSYFRELSITYDYFAAFLNGVNVNAYEADPFTSNLDIKIEKSEGDDWFDYKFENGRFHFGIQENLTTQDRKGKLWLTAGSVRKAITVYQSAVALTEVRNNLSWEAASLSGYQYWILGEYTGLTYEVEYKETDVTGWVQPVNLEPDASGNFSIEVAANESAVSRSCVVRLFHKGVLPVMEVSITQAGKTE